jgi:membrane protease YdiL (CAAX protease family)
MPYLNFNSASPLLKLVISFLSIITIGIIVYFLGFLLSRIIFCIDVPEANAILHGSTNTFSLMQFKFNQLIQTLGFFIIPGFFLWWLFSTPEQNYFSLRKISTTSVILVILALVFAIPFFNFLIEYNKTISFPTGWSDIEGQLHQSSNQVHETSIKLLTADNIGVLLLNLLILALLPALGEEFIFRGIFQKVFFNISKNIHMAVLLSAILFSAVHGQFFAFIPRFALGVFFGYLMVWSGSIWLPVMAHFVNNAIVVLLYFFYAEGIFNILPENIGEHIVGRSTHIISLGLALIVILVIKKLESKSQ